MLFCSACCWNSCVLLIERDDRSCVEVIAGALRRVLVGSRLAHAPIGEIQWRIVRPGQPDGPACPVFLGRFADHVWCPGSPGPGTCRSATLLCRSSASYAATNPRMPYRPADADHDLVLDHERGERQRVCEPECPRRAPFHYRAARSGVEGDEPGIERAYEQRVAGDPRAAIVGGSDGTSVGRACVCPVRSRKRGRSFASSATCRWAVAWRYMSRPRRAAWTAMVRPPDKPGYSHFSSRLFTLSVVI